jgi:DNA-binding response OmpR family regulator
MYIDKVLGLHIAKVQDYITKPFSPAELLKSIEQVLGEVSAEGGGVAETSEEEVID